MSDGYVETYKELVETTDWTSTAAVATRAARTAWLTAATSRPPRSRRHPPRANRSARSSARASGSRAGARSRPSRRTTDRRRGSSSSSRWPDQQSAEGVQRPAQLGAAHRRKTPDASVSRLRSAAEGCQTRPRTRPQALVRTKRDLRRNPAHSSRDRRHYDARQNADRVAARDDEHRAALVLCLRPPDLAWRGALTTAPRRPSPSRALRPTRHRPRLRHALVAGDDRTPDAARRSRSTTSSRPARTASEREVKLPPLQGRLPTQPAPVGHARRTVPPCESIALCNAPPAAVARGA